MFPVGDSLKCLVGRPICATCCTRSQTEKFLNDARERILKTLWFRCAPKILIVLRSSRSHTRTEFSRKKILRRAVPESDKAATGTLLPVTFGNAAKLLPCVCPREGCSFILNVCLEAIDRIRSSYFSCLSALSNRTGVSARRSTDSGHE